MNHRGKEINQIVYKNSLDIDYLAEQDRYLYKKKEVRYRFNIIGAGMMAQEHMRVTELEGRGEIHGIYDININSVKQAVNMYAKLYPEKELVVYNHLEEACSDRNIDGVIICTPNYSHLRIVLAAIKYGKAILLEKPMATTVEDALQIKEIAKSYRAVFQVGLQYRYKAIYAEAWEEVIKRKSLGKVFTINIMEHRLPFLDKVDQWNKFSEYSGGTLVEKCCHYFDLFNLFAQSKPESVYAVGGRAVNFKDFEYGGKESDILDNAVVTVVYKNGVTCNFNLCMFAPMFYEEITICGDKGRLRAYENKDFLPCARPETHLVIAAADSSPSKISTPCYPSVIQNSGHMGGTYFEHKKFIDHLDGIRVDTATADDGFWSVVVASAAEKSVKTGKIINIDEFLADQDRYVNIHLFSQASNG